MKVYKKQTTTTINIYIYMYLTMIKNNNKILHISYFNFFFLLTIYLIVLNTFFKQLMFIFKIFIILNILFLNNKNFKFIDNL